MAEARDAISVGRVDITVIGALQSQKKVHLIN